MVTGSINRSSQFQWIVLLTAVVVLPTVSLLWFMSRAVGNERLVIQQKLTALYGQQLEDAGEQVKHRMNEQFDDFSRIGWAHNPYGLLRRLVLTEGFQGVVLWDRDGALVYPSVVPQRIDEQVESRLADAWQLEFTKKNPVAAVERYSRLAASGDPRALAGQVRCLTKLNRWDDAVQVALISQRSAAAPARLLLLSLLQKNDSVAGRQDMQARLIRALSEDLFNSDSDSISTPDLAVTDDNLPVAQNLFVARKLLAALEPDAPEYSQLSQLAAAEQLSLEAADVFPVPSGPIDTIVPIQIGDNALYVIRHPTAFFGEMLIVISNEGLASALDGYREAFAGTEVHVRILDPWGNQIAGERGGDIPPLLSSALPSGFPSGTIELFFADGDMFNKVAGRQITIYVWTGALVILLMLVVGAFAVQAVGRQIRLNKMKNDFIATVSHELKTPLASMRLLVDTLLEGRTRDEEHAREYLGMIARENERLTRMIENFLSFSRMERNKNAFTMAPASPAEIVDDAIDSVCTKYRANKCQLETDLAADLPEIVADHDAVVTVLINLLDNACKYTTDDKQIHLSVFAAENEVCFAVADNGIGMPRRQVRKIFDSFYQVDSSLARTVEGCGLGLSIVRFIMNAHKGRVEVTSRPGEGSTFTVRLPIARKNGAV